MQLAFIYTVLLKRSVYDCEKLDTDEKTAV